MRAFVALALVLGLLAPAAPVGAQDAEALRREMEQMRKQFEAMQEDNGGSAKQVSEYYLQATFIMGAHPADRF